MEHPEQLLPGFSMHYRGRLNAPKGKSDAEKDDLPEFEPFKGAVPRGPQDYNSLTLMKLDLHKNENTMAHRTNSFKHDNLIIRRGQKFTMTLTFNRTYNLNTDTAMLEFVMGKNSLSGKATYVIVLLGPKCPISDQTCKWVVDVRKLTGDTMTVGITPSADCIIGQYHIFLTVLNSSGKKRTDLNTEIYVLFNAWCPEDEVFLSDENQRKEYVLNDQGIIFNGETNNVASRPWNFGQYKPGVLDACFYVLNMSGILLDDRKSVILVTRRTSAMVNALDDNGVLVGNWSGVYTMGTSPSAWTGSAEILLQYSNSGTPVSYAQCWVYAGVFNTILRCLGVPCRVVTNYNSSHDSNGNLTIDIFIDEDGTMNRTYTNDSVWNYHCWNEAYMRRSDLTLDSKYWGWQVVDATPQETSNGFYQCGPTSVKAIKEGDLCYPYDAQFVFAEVNSDVVYKMVDRNGQWTTVQKDTTYVGKKILTKAVGSNVAESIMDNYKYEEGSPSDVATMERATSFGCARDRSLLQETDVDIELMAPSVQLGQHFYLTLGIKNKSLEQRTVQLTVTCSVIYYTGVNFSSFKEERKTVSLGPSMTKNLNIEILANEYMDHMVDQGSLKFICVGKVQENNQVLAAGQVVRMEVPILSLKLDGEVRVGHEMSVTMEFTNIFNMVLEHVHLRMEGPGEMGFKKKYYEYIAPGASLTWTESFVPEMPGEGTMVGSLDCPKLRQVYGKLEFYSQP
ncbi:coagulation factor XIII A chain-like isoform X1 [Alosa sapidissima]|uniref:coagulation factor XIII A chain-like isoform X1 n=1 Tax=Alosa sapidissima TaxID=34773 RepID=UPI001C0975E5|nr:coagulation factor XIII A chain-like isoform X1 [Alosa sapidissima]